jgi:hypothetical protein
VKPYRVTVQTTLLVYAPSEDDATDMAWDMARWELGCQDAHDWFVSVEADSEVTA